MKKVKGILRQVDWYIHVTMVVSIVLIIVSFFIPPTGVIDGSVLAAVGELGVMTAMFSFLVRLPEYIKAGMSARIRHGNTSLELSKDGSDEDGKEAGDEVD